MRRASVVAAALAVALAIAACEVPTGEGTIVGSSSDRPIAGLVFRLDTTYIDGSGQGKLVAKGAVRSTASATVTSPWYVEGQFYTDGTLRTKLGGNYAQVGVPLSNGQETLWTLTFSSSNIDVRQYPEFRVGDLRGVYK